MKYKPTVVEVKTVITPKNRSSSSTPGILKEYKTIDVDGKLVKIPISRIIHNNSVIAYQEYASRRYKSDLDRIYRKKEVTVQIQVKTPMLPKWVPFRSLLETLFTEYNLVPYWTGNCYAQLVTHIVYTKEQFERGEQFSKDTEFGDSIHLHEFHSGCDKDYPGICIASAGLCTDYTTGNLDDTMRKARGENWCDWARRQFEDKYGYNPRTMSPTTVHSETPRTRGVTDE